MFSNLFIILPIFALILTGWIARKSGALGPNSTREINRLVIFIALPALLFDIMAKAKPADIWQPDFILAFTLGCAVVFFLTLFVGMRRGRHLADAALDGLNTSYANTGFIGFPLVLAVIGKSAMAGALIATIIVACVFFAIGIVLIEIGLQTETRRRDIAHKTLMKLVKNPMVISPILGTIVMVSPWDLPQPVDEFFSLVGGAAAPCALIALGLFLADCPAGKSTRTWKEAGLFTMLKLVLQPAVTWVFAVPVLGLAPAVAHLAVLLAALPTGTGPFMLAEFYNREALLTGRVVLGTTVFSVISLSVYLGLTY